MMMAQVYTLCTRGVRGGPAVDLSGDDTDVTIARMEAWWAIKRRIREEAEPTRTVADLPQWILNLADQLGVEWNGAG